MPAKFYHDYGLMMWNSSLVAENPEIWRLSTFSMLVANNVKFKFADVGQNIWHPQTFGLMVTNDVKSKRDPWGSCDLAPANFHRDSSWWCPVVLGASDVKMSHYAGSQLLSHCVGSQRCGNIPLGKEPVVVALFWESTISKCPIVSGVSEFDVSLSPIQWTFC